MKKHIFLYISIVICAAANAQVLSYDFYSFRNDNMFNVNPAYAGRKEDLNIVLSAQSQNKGVAYANKNYMLGVYSKFSTKQAVGGKLISDTRGAFQILKADLSYAYIAKVSDVSNLTLGLSGGILNNNLIVNRIENYQLLDQTDPTLTNSYYNTTQFSAGAGLLYNYKGLDVSVSLPHILATGQSFNGYVHSAIFYTVKASEKIKITPWLCYQNIPVTKSIGSLNVKALYNDMVWVQAGYQTNNTFTGALGVNIENFSLGYGFKMNNKQFNQIANGMHEVTLGFRIAKRSKVGAPIADNASLAEIVARLDKLSSANITDKNRENVKAELAKIKQLLQKAEVDNSSPEKAKEVSEQLIIIDEKLKFIEKKLLNEN